MGLFGSANPSGPSEPSNFDLSLLKDVGTSRDFRLAHPELVKRIKDLFEAYKRIFPHRDVIATCTYRSPGEQQRLYKQGRFGNPGKIITNCDGITTMSEHNKFPARAVDCAITEGGKAIWAEEVYWPLGSLSKECGLEWGGFWQKFQDFPHLQLNRDVA